MTEEELNQEEAIRLLNLQDKRTEQSIMEAFEWLFETILAAKIIRHYLNSNEPIPISDTKRLKGLSDFINLQIIIFLKKTNIVIVQGIENSWIIRERYENTNIKNSIPPELYKKLSEKGLFAHRKAALDQFIERKVKKLKLSQRVWKLGPQIKMEIESIIQMGVLDGRTASLISSDLLRHLKEPDKLFRRIRDAKGDLQLSKAAAAYNPGRGVYRSSYKNAMRLARNETNKAYRAAGYERVQTLDFVIGTKISLSNSHSKRMPEGDICDHLQGVYPKNFRWSGWHVLCMCRVTSVLASDKEIEAYLKTYDTKQVKLPKQIKTFPPGLKKWSDENKHRYVPHSVDWIDENEPVLKLFKS